MTVLLCYLFVCYKADNLSCSLQTSFEPFGVQSFFLGFYVVTAVTLTNGCVAISFMFLYVTHFIPLLRRGITTPVCTGAAVFATILQHMQLNV